MPKFIINVPKEWGDKEKDELANRLKNVFHKDDEVFITNKMVVHTVDTKTYDMLEDMKKRLDENG